MKHEVHYSCDICGKKSEKYGDVRGDVSFTDISGETTTLSEACNSCVRKVKEYIASISKVNNHANTPQQDGKFESLRVPVQV